MSLAAVCIGVLAIYVMGEIAFLYPRKPKQPDMSKVRSALHEYSVMVAVQQAQDEAAIRMILAEAGLFEEVAGD